MRKHSIKRQFAFIFIALMAGIILLCWFMNNVFLEKYYVSSKMDVIIRAYKTIGEAATGDTYGTDEFADELNDICNVSNLTICIMDANSQMKYESVNGGRELENQLIGYIFGFEKSHGRVLEIGEDYTIQVVSFAGNESGNVWKAYVRHFLYYAYPSGKYPGECEDCKPFFCLCGNSRYTGGSGDYLDCFLENDETDSGIKQDFGKDGTSGF